MQKYLKKIPILLVLIILLSILLNFLFLYKEGYGNLYYAAAIKSMLTSFKNFFFVSFDSAGFVTVDKPPLGLWIQAIFVLIFGFSGFSMIFPQAIAGVLSVIFLYILIKNIFDKRTGLLSAFILTITPMIVALSRNNTMDMLVVLSIILASWFFFKSIQNKSFKYLILTFVLIALGFNIKMLLAFTILPAIGITWLLSRHIPFKKRFVQISIGILVLFVISFSWIFIIDLYPEQERPYIGSTKNNSAIELAISHNGLLRILSPVSKAKRKFLKTSTFSFYSFGPGGPPAVINEAGKPGILRFFNKQIAGQISWFFSVLLLGLIFSVFKIIKNKHIVSDIKQLSILYWFLWLIPYFFFLSYTNGIFHIHYVVVLAPSIAALIGIFFIQLWDSYNSEEKIGFLFPAAVFLTGLLHFYIINLYDIIPKQYGLIILIITSIITIILILKKLSVNYIVKTPNIFLYLPVIIILSVSPFYWACTPLIYGGNIALPYASPDLDRDPAKGSSFISKTGTFDPDLKIMYDFLINNNDKEEFLVATPSSYAYGVSLILYQENKNNPVMTIGGFTGGDPILNLNDLKNYIDDGKVRFFFVPTTLGDPNKKGNIQLYYWIIEHGKKIDKKLWYSPLISSINSQPFDLYDMK